MSICAFQRAAHGAGAWTGVHEWRDIRMQII